MKSKSLFLPGTTLIKWHALAFTVFTVALWWNVLSALMTHVDPATPFSVYGGFIMSRIGATLFAGLVLLAHFAVHQIRLWWHIRTHQSHLNSVSKMQEQHVSGARLDLEQVDDGNLLIDESEWIAEQRLESK